jgi:hypothetical protein
MKFHLKQLEATCALVDAYQSNGYIYVSCSTWHNSKTPEDSNAHFPLMLKMFKDGTPRDVIIDIDGFVYSVNNPTATIEGLSIQEALTNGLITKNNPSQLNLYELIEATILVIKNT